MARKSLGALTLDLVARVGGFEAGMDKASRKSKKTSSDISKHAKTMSIAFAAGTAAAVVGISALVSRQLEVIDAQAKMAQRLRTTYDSLTDLGRAGELAGVSMQQIEVASRTLDVNLGKAAQGIGAQADALAKLKLNADDIAALPLDERISAINTALKENVSVTERAAVAADLFGTRSAAAIQMLDPDTIAEAARQTKIFGLNLSDVDAAKIEQANDAMGTFGLLIPGISQQLTVELAPALRAIGNEFLRSAEDAGGLGTVVQETTRDIVKAVAFAIDAADGFWRVVDTIISGIVTLGSEAVQVIGRVQGFALSTLDKIPGLDLSTARESVANLVEFADAMSIEAQERIQNNLNKPLSGQAILDFYDRAQEAGQVAAEETIAARKAADNYTESLEGTSHALEKIVVTSKKWTVSKEMLSAIKANEDYLALVRELRTDEERLTDQLNERFAVLEKIAGLTSAEREDTAGRIAAAAFVDAPDYGGLAPEIGGAFGELGKINEAESQLEDWYKTQLEMLEGFRADRADLNAVWDEQELALKQEHEEKLANIESARQQASLAATEDLFGNLSEITATFAGKQSGIYKAMFAIEKAAAIARSIVAIQTGIAQAAANPFPANLAAMASVAAATASIIGTIQSVSIAGQAHDGIDSIPKSGTWNLEKGERVTTAKTSAKLDKTLTEVQSSMGEREQSGRNLRIVNAFDTSVIGEYMGSDPGEEVIMNAVRRNARVIRSLSV